MTDPVTATRQGCRVRFQGNALAPAGRSGRRRVASAKSGQGCRSSRPSWSTAKPTSTDPLERRNGEIKRWTEDVGISAREAAVIRLVGAIPLEQDDE